MLSLSDATSADRKEQARVRVLAAVRRKGPALRPVRIIVVTLSLLLLLAVPVLEIVRIDLWAGHHRLLGEAVNATTAIKGFVVAMAILYGFTFLTNMLVGRYFCGFGCPVGFVSRLGEDVDLARAHVGQRVLGHLLGAGFVATFVASIMLWWVDPAVLTQGSNAARGITIGVFALLCAGGFLHAFGWRFGFCVRACPIGLYYRYVTSRAPFGIVFVEDPSPCIACGACETVCPVSIDPKRLGESLEAEGEDAELGTERYGDAECIRCGDCVAACRMVFLVRPGQTAPLRLGRNRADPPSEARSG